MIGQLFQGRIVLIFRVAVLCALLATLACTGRGRVRISDKELSGTYVAQFALGQEELSLFPDKTYTQAFSSPTNKFMNLGSWKTSNGFFEGTVVQLERADISEDSSDSAVKYGYLRLVVHRENGKIRLARNEAADWYYEKSK